MSLWFVSSAILPDLTESVSLSATRGAALASAVQFGFVLGALALAFSGLPDRYDPRTVFGISAVLAGVVNTTLLFVPADSNTVLLARVLTGALLAGVYPVGMKIIVGWGVRDRGLLVGALTGALALGSASPHLVALLGGAEWRLTVLVTSFCAALAGISCLGMELGPYHAKSPGFDRTAVITAWSNRRIRLAYAGYLGHMFEMFAMWAWIGAASLVSYRMVIPEADAQALSKLTAFLAIGSCSITCVLAGYVADRVGKAETAMTAMVISGSCAVLSALVFGGPVWLVLLVAILWGLSVAPDSAQFSALVADAAPPAQVGSLMTLQTALGFALTVATVQLTPVLADSFGWPVVLASLALGPALGTVAMVRLRRLSRG